MARRKTRKRRRSAHDRKTAGVGLAGPLTIAKTVRGLAELVGRSPAAVSGWLRRTDWPFPRQPPWDAARVLVWASKLAPNPATAPHDRQGAANVAALLEQARAQVFANRALLLRLEYERRAGILHDAGKCRERHLRQIHAARAALDDLPRLAPSLEGRSRDDVARILMERVEHILAVFAGDA